MTSTSANNRFLLRAGVRRPSVARGEDGEAKSGDTFNRLSGGATRSLRSLKPLERQESQTLSKTFEVKTF
jgi:hypothetical protein